MQEHQIKTWRISSTLNSGYVTNCKLYICISASTFTVFTTAWGSRRYVFISLRDGLLSTKLIRHDGNPAEMPLVKLGTYVCFWLGQFDDTSAYKHWPNCNCNKLQHSIQHWIRIHFKLYYAFYKRLYKCATSASARHSRREDAFSM